MAQPTTLGPLRHQCHLCAACCTGVRPAFIDDAERQRVDRLGLKLDIVDPVDTDAPRFVDGSCVFLGSDRRCRLHTTFGPTSKPLRCQEFPLKKVRTETELRMAIDPACTTSWQSWRGGPTVEPDAQWSNDQPLSAPEQGAERALLGLFHSEQISIGGWLQLMAGRPQQRHLPELPPGYASRLITRANELRLGQFLSHPEVGFGLREALGHLVPALKALSVDQPPAWPVLEPEMEAFAIEVTRRMIFLRIAPLAPITQGTTILTLAGAVLCAWADPRPDVYGPALSGWTRALRFRAFWLRLAPDPNALRWLATGGGPEPKANIRSP